MGLSKDYTLKSARSTIQTLVKRLGATNEIIPDEVDNLIHLGLCHVVGRLGEAVGNDYGEKQAVTLITPPSYSPVTATSWADATKTITKAAHGLSVGTPLVYWDDGGKIAVGHVVSVPTTGTFTVNIAIGATVTNIKYQVFTSYDGSAIDISALRLNNIMKLVDDTNGIIREENIKEVEEITNHESRNKHSWWYRFGNYIYVVKGTEAPSFGTLNLYYNRIPTKATLETDTLDIRDEFVKVSLDITKTMVYETLKEQVPESLTNSINATINQLIQDNMREEAARQSKGKSK
jgi:hypothetical protein